MQIFSFNLYKDDIKSLKDKNKKNEPHGPEIEIPHKTKQTSYYGLQVPTSLGKERERKGDLDKYIEDR